MLSFLRGSILLKSEGHIILDVRDVGYRVAITKTLLVGLQIGETVELFLHHYLREDMSDLYGFREAIELELFEKLLSVSGVGPKSALAILGLAPATTLQTAIAQGDASLLTKVSGIGGKTAERIVLELRGKVASLGEGSQYSEEIEALVNLGYSSAQAREALRKVDAQITDSSERIRQALQHI